MSAILREQQVGSLKRSPIQMTSRLEEAYKAIGADPHNAMNYLELGHALADQRLFREAIEAFSKGIAEDPFCGILYRWRAHRHLSCWEFPEACADFAMAARMLPNDFDVWYHYGLSWYLQGEYAEAEDAYEHCLVLKKDEEDLTAAAAWMWRTLMMQGKKERAQKILDMITPETQYGENIDYFRCLLMAKGMIAPEKLMCTGPNCSNQTLSVVTSGYGLANYYYLQGNMEKYHQCVDMVLQAGREEWWNAFGYLACVAEQMRKL